MNRKYHKIDSNLSKIELCIDPNCDKEVIKFLSIPKNKKKLELILHSIERNRASKSLYERYTSIADNVSAIKFTRGRENARIYCQYQKESSNLRIIMVEFLHKKSSDNLTKSQIIRLESISKYEYEPFTIST